MMDHTKDHTFSKQERLCSKKLMDDLFRSGHRFLAFPFSVHWMRCEASVIPMQAQVLIATSKKKFHHAVDRNRAKRMMRECYRLRKPELYTYLDSHNSHLLLAINYIHSEHFDYPHLQAKYDKMLSQLLKQMDETL